MNVINVNILLYGRVTYLIIRSQRMKELDMNVTNVNIMPHNRVV